jgi:hypothetical protein
MEPQAEEQPINPFKAFLIVVGILGIIIAGIFIAGRFYTPREPSRLIYNQFEFKKADGVWKTEWQRDGQVYDITLRYNPKEVESVPVSGGLNGTFKRQPFYLTFDPDENSSDFKYLALGIAELGLNLVRGMGAQIESACTKNLSDACGDHAIVTCDDDDKAVFYLRTAPEPRVTLDGNCLVLEGKELDLLKAVDRVLYHFYRIMP